MPITEHAKSPEHHGNNTSDGATASNGCPRKDLHAFCGGRELGVWESDTLFVDDNSQNIRDVLLRNPGVRTHWVKGDGAPKQPRTRLKRSRK